MVEINTKRRRDIHSLNVIRSKQIMMQFLYRKQKKICDRSSREKLVFFIHQEAINLYNFEMTRKNDEDCNWVLDKKIISTDCLARSFIWAQWDPVHQSLFYIHFRKPVKSLVEGDDGEDTIVERVITSPTLSGLQFHDDLPHETVVCFMTVSKLLGCCTGLMAISDDGLNHFQNCPDQVLSAAIVA